MNFLLDPGIAIYAALAVALVVWIALFVFLWRIDRQTRELRRKLDNLPPLAEPQPTTTLEVRRGAEPSPDDRAQQALNGD